ncbi:MAG TPA: FAD-dependent monooxygenase, partial [Xanthobacteraceae bacterium]|nr:FAD-dependent monooxygenase [Xanthobacteraceae bacterium]
ADTVRTAVWPESRNADFVYLDHLRGRELARSRRPTSAQRGTLAQSPETACHCPQIFFDPILAGRARSLPGVTLRYGVRLDGFAQDGEAVRARLSDVASGAIDTLTARYLVGCDGPAGVVRAALGINLGGLGVVANSVNIFFRSAELASLHDKGWARIYRLIDSSGCWGELIPIDGKALWRLTVFEDPAAAENPAAALFRMAGGAFPHEILSVSRWERRDSVAERYGAGRVLIAGDAAHECSPTAGLGMHTGIEEAVNLAWKLAAVIAGWGGSGLVGSYEAERRPIALRNVALSTATFQGLRRIPGLDEAAGLGPDAWRDVLAATSPSEEYKLDYGYDGSPICVADAEPGLPVAARPGARAPHAWLSEGRSTLDLFGDGFVLLCFAGAGERAAPLIGAAEQRGVPLRAVAIDDPAVAARYGAALVLVRPDAHVAWRGDAVVAPDAIIDRVRGALSPDLMQQPSPRSAAAAMEASS